jgi:segregation and condensation protein B
MNEPIANAAVSDEADAPVEAGPVENQKDVPLEPPPESPVEKPAEIPQENPAEPATSPQETPVENPPEIPQQNLAQSVEENLEEAAEASPASQAERRQVEPHKLKQIIEGALLAVGKPLPIERLESLFQEPECPDRAAFEAALAAIAEDCAERGFELKKVASGYRFQVKQHLAEWIGRLWEEKPQRYSRALMETLSIVAYRQPITRGDIEKIRGVAVSTQIVQTLLEHEWIRVVGHRDVPGRPAMYATTKQFLDYFNLESLDQLPPLSEIRDLEEINRELSLEDAKPVSRIIEFPDPEPGDTDDSEDDEAAAAAAIGTRPISEILGEVDARLLQRGGATEASADDNLMLDLESEADFDAAEAAPSAQEQAAAADADDAEDSEEASDGDDTEGGGEDEDERPSGS